MQRLYVLDPDIGVERIVDIARIQAAARARRKTQVNLRAVAVDHGEDRWLVKVVRDDPEPETFAIIFRGAPDTAHQKERAAHDQSRHGLPPPHECPPREGAVRCAGAQSAAEFARGARRLSDVARSVFISVLAVAALAACTPMRWEHPQLAMADADQELRECSIRARQEVWRNSFMYRPLHYPMLRYRDNQGRLRYADPVIPRHRDTTFDEWHLRDYCMRSKGWQLVPVPEQAASAGR